MMIRFSNFEFSFKLCPYIWVAETALAAARAVISVAKAAIRGIQKIIELGQLIIDKVGLAVVQVESVLKALGVTLEATI